MARSSQPAFELDGSSHVGLSTSPVSRTFIPRLAKLKAHSGKSLSFYKKWRQFQFDMNGVMAKMIRAKKVRCSILRLPQNDDEDFEDFPDADLNFDDTFNITYAKEMGSNLLKL
ncbi:unnamed protein product [Oikopleura dioica]|uniref:Uncharacterized protein n=1 Tax=Oikopleura dioica TaxID=34765 RepID=E4Y6E6_OIKDI|nr:unnamed protein product [Oikopleura dioica]